MGPFLSNWSLQGCFKIVWPKGFEINKRINILVILFDIWW